MNQSNNRKNREQTAALYVRLSRDDNLEGESYSISNQKKLLTKAAKDKGFTSLLTFTDDGVSGTTMERPGFQKMVQELEKGYISAVLVKDMSRLGRNYLKVGYYTEEFFPDHDIRLIAVSDGVDSLDGDNEFTPFRNIMNEWYARDISKKRRVTNKIKGNAGEPLSPPPYGYIKDPNNPKRWIVEEDAAAVVRRIFSMTIEGCGVEEIASALEQDKIFTPTFYWKSKGIRRGGTKNAQSPYRWNHSTVIKILSLQEYCGDVINFKTYSKSYKNKRRIPNEENQVVFHDVHEPIIERSAWEKLRQQRGKVRKRANGSGEKNMFSGLLFCADCGANMNFHYNYTNHTIQYFNCTNNNRSRKNCPTTHYIRVDFLKQVVLSEIRRLTRFANRYEDDFVKAVMGYSQEAVERNRQSKQKELNAMITRDRELDGLFERIYEDNVSGKISDERFSKMSAKYESEQGELAERIKTVRAEFEKETDKSMSTDIFISNVRKYTRAKKLTPRLLNELIERIDVHQAEKIDGVHVQKLIIHYNCVGTIQIPDILPLRDPDILIQTRKGVAISYSNSQNIG